MKDMDSCFKMLPSQGTVFIPWLVLWVSVQTTSASGCQDIQYGCTCLENPLEVQCLNTNLEHIPEDLPDHIEILTFRGNRISVVDYIPIVYNGVRHLGLDNNGIRFLRDNCFQDMSNLRELVMENNEISGIQSSTFTGLVALEYLDISYNHLYELINGTFNGSVLPSLRHLILTHSKINQIHRSAFHHLDKLTELDLSFNDLALKSPFIFPVLLSLTDLDLSHNLIGSTLEYATFDNTRSLQKLDLSGNRIHVIRSTAFTGLEQDLATLLLNNNGMYFIEEGALNILTNLSTLNISHNRLQTLEMRDSDIFNISILIVHNNPWGCECENDWLIQHPHLAQWNANSSLLCASPPSLNGTPVFNVSESHFLKGDCSLPRVHHMSHPAIVIPLALVSIFLVMVAVILGAWWFVTHKCRRLSGATGGSGPGLSYSRMEEITEEAFGETL